MLHHYWGPFHGFLYHGNGSLNRAFNGTLHRGRRALHRGRRALHWGRRALNRTLHRGRRALNGTLHGALHRGTHWHGLRASHGSWGLRSDGSRGWGRGLLLHRGSSGLLLGSGSSSSGLRGRGVVSLLLSRGRGCWGRGVVLLSWSRRGSRGLLWGSWSRHRRLSWDGGVIVLHLLLLGRRCSCWLRGKRG